MFTSGSLYVERQGAEPDSSSAARELIWHVIIWPEAAGVSGAEYVMSLEALKSFDAFPERDGATRARHPLSFVTGVFVALALTFLIYLETTSLMGASTTATFSIDKNVASTFQFNLDITVASPCKTLSIFITDVSQDVMFVNELVQAKPVGPLTYAGADDQNEPIPDDHWCRLTGSFAPNKVKGVLQITPRQTGIFRIHRPMNFSHTFHELSFGPYLPAIEDPLDEKSIITFQPNDLFNYFLSIVSHTFRALGMEVETATYTVTELSQALKNKPGFSGIFLQYDFEPIAVTLTDARMSFMSWLFRVANIIGGLWIASSSAYAWVCCKHEQVDDDSDLTDKIEKLQQVNSF